MKPDSYHNHFKGNDVIFKVSYYTDHVYSQDIVSIAFRQPLDDVLSTARCKDGTPRGQLAKILEKADGVESLRFHRYSLDVIHAQTYSGDEIRETIYATFTRIGCALDELKSRR